MNSGKCQKFCGGLSATRDPAPDTPQGSLPVFPPFISSSHWAHPHMVSLLRRPCPLDQRSPKCPQPFGDQGHVSGKTDFLWTVWGGEGLGTTQTHHVYCALYSYCCCVVIYKELYYSLRGRIGGAPSLSLDVRLRGFDG